MMNIQRKMRSMTMATYFQSSFTCKHRCRHPNSPGRPPESPQDPGTAGGSFSTSHLPPEAAGAPRTHLHQGEESGRTGKPVLCRGRHHYGAGQENLGTLGILAGQTPMWRQALHCALSAPTSQQAVCTSGRGHGGGGFRCPVRGLLSVHQCWEAHHGGSSPSPFCRWKNEARWGHSLTEQGETGSLLGLG